MINTILNEIVKCSENKFDLSKTENLEYFIKSYPLMDIYKKYYLDLSKKNNADANINSLLFMNLLLQDCAKYIADNQSEIKKTHQFRLGAIGKISFRFIEITDEILALLRNGFGTSVISNLRLMLESYSISKYLMAADDLESDRFQDFGIVQECKIQNTDPKIKLKEKNYTDDFYNAKSDFAWISDKKVRTSVDLINRIEIEKIKDWYKFYCKYVHASPYSCGKILQMNQSSLKNDNAYMPIEMNKLILQNKYYLVLIIELLADNFILEKSFRNLFKKVSQLIYDFKK